MADTNQSPFVAIIASPSATPYTYEPVVRTFTFFYDTVRMSEGRPERGRHSSTVWEVTEIYEKSFEGDPSENIGSHRTPSLSGVFGLKSSCM